VSHFGDETSACLEPNLYADFGDFVARLDRHTRSIDGAQFGWIVALRIHLLAVENTMQPERLSAWATRGQGGGEDLDPLGGEAFDVQNVQAFPKPVDEEIAGIGSVSSDYPRVPLLDRGGIHSHREHALSRIGEGLPEGRSRREDPLATGSLEVGVAQAGPPPRSP
jgi:hypothetical protein